MTTTTDEDLRLVAEAVGFRLVPDPLGITKEAWMNPEGLVIGLLPPMHRSDAAAVSYLLPWLEKKAQRGGNVRVNYCGPGLYFAELEYRGDLHGKVVCFKVPPRPSFASALFSLCLHIIKENPA